MITFLSIVAIGFFLGMRHATDPDHVVAVATIVTRQQNLGRSALIGAFWGLGHTVTIFLVGAGIILFNLVISPRIGLSMELSVGIMLIVLGAANVIAFLRSMPRTESNDSEEGAIVHSHPHSHGDLTHAHAHIHAEAHLHSSAQKPVAYLDRWFGKAQAYQHLRPLVIGIVHGLAGSAAVALLVLTTIRDPRWAIAYLLVFGVGTIAGMMVITMSLASAIRLAGRGELVIKRLGMASGLLSLGFGMFVVYQIGFVSGLFTSHPAWTPK